MNGTGITIHRSMGVGGRLFGSLFFLMFFGMGSLFCGLIVREVYRAAKTYSWPKAECVIIESRVKEDGKNERPYRFQVRYDYQWQGRTYTGAKATRQQAAYSDYSDAQRLVSKYPADSKAECFVNPENPSEAILKRPSMWIGLFIFLPLIFVGIGALGVVAMWAKTGTKPPIRRKEGLLSPSAAKALEDIPAFSQGEGKPPFPRGREGEPEASSPVGSNRGGKKVGFGLGAFFFTVGALGFYFIAGRPLQQVVAARNWVSTPCTVVSSRVQRQSSNDGTTYRVDILYRYEFKGEEHRSSRYQFNGLSSSGYKGKAEIVRRHPAGTQRNCFVNPQDPTEAVLERGLTADMWFGAIPAVFMIVGAAGMVRAWRGEGTMRD